MLGEWDAGKSVTRRLTAAAEACESWRRQTPGSTDEGFLMRSDRVGRVGMRSFLETWRNVMPDDLSPQPDSAYGPKLTR